METGLVKVHVHVDAMASSQSGILHTVVINLSQELEQIIVNESDGIISSIGSYPDSSFPNLQILVKLRDFRPNHVFQLLRSRIHDPVLCRQLSHQIVVEAHKRSQGFDFPQRSLFMHVFATLTQKVYLFVPCTTKADSAHDSDTSCAICFENLSESDPNSICQLPNCVHWFHEDCIKDWSALHDSCPLCRQAIN